MHLAKPCPCAGAFYLLLAIYTQSPAFQQLLFMLLADLPRQSTLVFLIRLKSLRQSNLQPCCSYLLLKFNIWNIQGRRIGFCQAEKVPCLCVTQTLTEKRVRMGEWTAPVLCSTVYHSKMKILHAQNQNSVNCKATCSIIHFFLLTLTLPLHPKDFALDLLFLPGLLCTFSCSISSHDLQLTFSSSLSNKLFPRENKRHDWQIHFQLWRIW